MACHLIKLSATSWETDLEVLVILSDKVLCVSLLVCMSVLQLHLGKNHTHDASGFEQPDFLAVGEGIIYCWDTSIWVDGKELYASSAKSR